MEPEYHMSESGISALLLLRKWSVLPRTMKVGSRVPLRCDFLIETGVEEADDKGAKAVALLKYYAGKRPHL